MSESTQTLHINGEEIKLYDNTADVGANKVVVNSLFAKMDATENNNVNNSKTSLFGNKILVRNFTTISTIPSQSGSLTYTGASRTPSWNNYSATNLSIGGTTSAIGAGSYTATFTPKHGYSWTDWSTSAKSNTWSIGKTTGTCAPATTSVGVTTTNCQCNQCVQCSQCTYYNCSYRNCYYYNCYWSECNYSCSCSCSCGS